MQKALGSPPQGCWLVFDNCVKTKGNPSESWEWLVIPVNHKHQQPIQMSNIMLTQKFVLIYKKLITVPRKKNKNCLRNIIAVLSESPNWNFKKLRDFWTACINSRRKKYYIYWQITKPQEHVPHWRRLL